MAEENIIEITVRWDIEKALERVNKKLRDEISCSCVKPGQLLELNPGLLWSHRRSMFDVLRSMFPFFPLRLRVSAVKK